MIRWWNSRNLIARWARFCRRRIRDILFSLCQYGQADVWKWGREAGGQMWRTGGDIAWGPKGVYSLWDNIAGLIDAPNLAPWAGPGGWNDPLEIGWIAYVNSDVAPPVLHVDKTMPAPLTPDEQRAQMSLWSLMAAPLFVSVDLTKMDDFTLSVLENDEVIAIDQDELGKAGARVWKHDRVSLWARELKDGARAVALFNLGDRETDAIFKWRMWAWPDRVPSAMFGLTRTPARPRGNAAAAFLPTALCC